jgi:DNA invertase Pin-like site-specific DNA recombinase
VLKKAGCRTVVKDEGLSGATTKFPNPLRCPKKLEHGDTLTVWKFDRPGRSQRDLIRCSTTYATGRAMWQMIGLSWNGLVSRSAPALG